MKFLKGNNAVSEHHIHFYVNIHLISSNYSKIFCQLPCSYSLILKKQCWYRDNRNNKIFIKVHCTMKKVATCDSYKPGHLHKYFYVLATK